MVVKYSQKAAFSLEAEKATQPSGQKNTGDVKLQWESQVYTLGNGYFGASALLWYRSRRSLLSVKNFLTRWPWRQFDYNFGIVPESDFSHIGEIKADLHLKATIAEADKLVAKYLL